MYLAAHEAGWRSSVHRQQWRQTLKDYVLPILGEHSVTTIDTGLVMKVVEPLWREKTESASRIRGRIEAILNYAIARGWRDGPNPARWSGHLANLLPAPAKVRKPVHHAAVVWDQIGTVMAGLAERGGMAPIALRFLMLTAVRSSEARGARWGEIDLDRAVWTIPPERMKAHAEHRVPLAPAALAILHELTPLRTGPDALVFQGGTPAKPISDVSLSKLLPADCTIHGMRSTFRDWGGETTAYPREVIEMALAHRLGDKAEQAYARGDLFQKRRLLMEAWATFCTQPAQTGEVVPPRARA